MPNFTITSRCWFYGPHAKSWFFPEASGSTTSIVVVIDAPNDHEEAYSSAYGRHGDNWAVGAYDGFGERYQGGDYNEKRHWYDNLPEFLIGAT